jgi:hypothetical protein
MIVSEEYRFIFLAVPHTGSSTIQRMLEPVHKGWHNFEENNHITPDRLRGHSDIMGLCKWNWFRKICFVRNPWDRYVALFMYANKMHRQANRPIYETFGDYVASGGYEGMHHSEFLLHREGTRAVDFVGRFEKINEDIRRMYCFIGLPEPQNIPHFNRSEYNNRRHYTEYYQRWMVDAVAAREKYVIEKFGYVYGQDGASR